MACEQCGTVFYSAAAKTLVERGETCAKCGGPLALEPEPAPAPAPATKGSETGG